jgi:predicted anti-sigma-YlaC factor YlaD
MFCEHARQQIEHMSQPEDANAGLTQHLVECDSCRNLFEERRLLQDAIARLRSETSRVGPSRRVEQHVLAALNVQGLRPYAASDPWRWLVASALVSVTVLIVIVIVAFLMTTHRNPAVVIVQAADEQFTAMPYVIPAAPYERTSVVRTEVPLQIMLSAGFHVQGEDLSSSILADVLYGEDGRILALRLVSQPSDFSTTRMD